MTDGHGETPRRLSQRYRHDLTVLAAAVPAGAVVGTLYDLFQGWPLAVAFSGGGIAGALIAGVLVAAQLCGLPGSLRRRLRNWPAIVYVAMTYASALAVVLAAFAVGGLTGSLAASGPVSVTYVFAPSGILFALGVAAIFVAATALDRIVGPDVLLGIFTGRYLTPVREYRVVLFADLVGSTALAERIGDLAFHRYLDELLTLLAECVRRHRGRIYRYVGDEMIVTWRTDRDGARAAARVLACVADCRRTLRAEAPYFERAFGWAPEMRFALHAGPVVAGTMGGIKQEVVLLGDTINSGAHLEEVAKTTASGIVASETVVRAPPSRYGFALRSLTRTHVRGKREPLQVYEVFEPAIKKST